MTDERYITSRQLWLARDALAKGRTLQEAAARCSITAAALDRALWKHLLVSRGELVASGGHQASRP